VTELLLSAVQVTRNCSEERRELVIYSAQLKLVAQRILQIITIQI
jgi:hypothetical protein